jgi:branched-chain amino acid transport system ATP-binding protein
MLKVNNIEVVYNEVILAVRGVSLEVPEKGIIALLGANGAGKSTIFKAISGILDFEDGEIKEGTIEFLGERVDKMDPTDIVRMGIIQVPENRGIFKELNVDENIKVGAFSRVGDLHNIKKDHDKVFDYFPILKERRRQIAGYLSGGEQQMLAIARALMSKPKLLMLDEPSLGLAPIIVNSIFDIVKKINDEEKTAILLVEQNVNIALSIASYGYIMENGKIVLCEKPLSIKSADVRILAEFPNIFTVSQLKYHPLIEKLKMEGITLIMVEHRLKELFKVADRVMALQFGEKIAEGEPEEVMQDPRVKRAYLGEEIEL